MFCTHTSTFRVRYAEADRMGYLYYGNYAAYFEVGRVELLRSLGIGYRELEDRGVLLPVRDFSVKYLKPAYYDDELRLDTTIQELGKARIGFGYNMFNSQGELITTAHTTLVFVNKGTGRPMAAPDDVWKALAGE